jgi:MFS family permease
LRNARGRYYGWNVVAALGVTTIISYGTSQYLFGLLVAPVSLEFGWSNAAIGAAYSGMVLVSGFAGLALGRALDRFGARLLMSAGSLLSGFSLLALSRAHELAAFDLIWAIGLGIGTALTYYPVSFTVVANWFDRRRAAALSLLTFLGALASPIAYPLAGWSIAALGWRETLVLLAGVQLLVALPLHAIVVRRHPEDLGLHPDGADDAGTWTPESGAEFARAARSAPFWFLTGALSLAYFGSTVILLEHIAYLVSRGFAPTLVASLAGLLGIVYLPARWLIAFLNARVGSSTLLAAAFVLEAAGVAILMSAHDVAAIVAYVTLFGVGYGATAPLRGALVAERFGRRDYGTIFASQNAIVAVASALGPLVAGRMIDVAGYPEAFLTCIASLVAAAVLVRLA